MVGRSWGRPLWVAWAFAWGLVPALMSGLLPALASADDKEAVMRPWRLLVKRRLLKLHQEELDNAQKELEMVQFELEKFSKTIARHDSAEDFRRLKARRCTAMDWIFIPAYCFVVP